MKRRRFLLFLTVLIFITSAYVLGWSTLFTVSGVEIRGANIKLSVPIRPGQKLARVEPRTVSSELEKRDWIKSAIVTRNWINGKVTITITARTPIAIYNNLAIDQDGVSFPILNQNIQGLARIQAPTTESAFSAAAFFNTLPNTLKSLITLIKVRSGEVYVLEIEQDVRHIEVIWGQDAQNSLKASVFQALIVRSENSKIRRIDLSAPHAPIVK